MRSAMATRKCRNIYFRNVLWPSGSSQIFISRNIFVLLLILMVVLRIDYIIHRLFHMSCAITTLKKATDRLNVA